MQNTGTATRVAVPPGDGYVGHVGSLPTNEVIRPDAAELGVVEHAALSDVGREREGNEDSFLERPPLFVVADGMGGAQAGEGASGMAVASPAEVHAPGALAEAIETANARIHERAQGDSSLAGMGTTLTAAWVDDGSVTLAPGGDSRGYRMRDGELVQLTEDHSLVGGLVRMGKITPAEAERHP